MSGQLFAFNVSKKTEIVEQQTNNQWMGDGKTRATHCSPCLCSGGQGYGLSSCIEGPALGVCTQDGSTGYYLCDPIY